jgi:hypothetical protein
MASIIAIDSRLLARLPPRARRKAANLVAAAQDSFSAFRAVIDRQERLREELALLASERRSAITRAENITTDSDAAQQAAAQYDVPAKELEHEIAQLDAHRASRDARHRQDAQLVAQVRYFLETLPDAVRLSDIVREPLPLRDNGNYRTAVDLVRAEVREIHRSLRLLASAPLPRDELKQRARAYISRTGPGRPP